MQEREGKSKETMYWLDWHKLFGESCCLDCNPPTDWKWQLTAFNFIDILGPAGKCGKKRTFKLLIKIFFSSFRSVLGLRIAQTLAAASVKPFLTVSYYPEYQQLQSIRAVPVDCPSTVPTVLIESGQMSLWLIEKKHFLNTGSLTLMSTVSPPWTTRGNPRSRSPECFIIIQISRGRNSFNIIISSLIWTLHKQNRSIMILFDQKD